MCIVSKFSGWFLQNNNLHYITWELSNYCCLGFLYYVPLLKITSAAAAAARSLQSCPTLCDPVDGSPPGSPVPGILQQEHWSGLPFPSPMHESEKWKGSRSVMSDPQQPHGLQPTRLLRPWDFPGKSAGVGCHCLLCPAATRSTNLKTLKILPWFLNRLTSLRDQTGFLFHSPGPLLFLFLPYWAYV